ncbi:MAG: hypothetical protein LBH65_03845 [Desulfovibrio sp.]|nr:hypothetical protein [Desulfovibrio sp.]
MEALKPFTNLEIAWNLTPEHAVTMYLEWGNNDWNAEYPPVRSKSDVSRYFVVDAWESVPMIRLVERNSEKAVDLASFPLPKELVQGFRAEHGAVKGLYAISEDRKAWLKKALGQDGMHS